MRTVNGHATARLSLKYLDATLQLPTCCSGFEVALGGSGGERPDRQIDVLIGAADTLPQGFPRFHVASERGRFATISKVEPR